MVEANATPARTPQINPKTEIPLGETRRLASQAAIARANQWSRAAIGRRSTV
jgi:hypothetical protein